MIFDIKSVPKSLRKVLPYIQRANEIYKKQKDVAYFCIQYALEIGVELSKGPLKGDKEAMNCLIQIMTKVEALKTELKPNMEEGRATVEFFALKVFARADAREQKGIIDATTMKLFMISSSVMQVTQQFEGGITDDFKEKQKYARWKATEINKMIKSGAAPKKYVPPPKIEQPSNDHNITNSETNQQDDSLESLKNQFKDLENDTNTKPNNQPNDSINDITMQFNQLMNETQTSKPEPIVQQPTIIPTTNSGKKQDRFEAMLSMSGIPSDDKSMGVPMDKINEAQKCAKYAMSSLQFQDVKTAKIDRKSVV